MSSKPSTFLLPPSCVPSVASVLRTITTFLLLLCLSCGSGDDDGQRLGELIVGTWQRGYAPGEVIIEGNTELTPENFTHDRFVFSGDGSYNGMVRDGNFQCLDADGNLIYEGTYRCDNNNLRLDFRDEDGTHRLLCQVQSFTDSQLRINYEEESLGINVTLTLHKR